MATARKGGKPVEMSQSWSIKDAARDIFLKDIPEARGAGAESGILICDNESIRVLSNSCRIQDIMDHDVVLVEKLHFNREPLRALDAIYFIKPTPENIDRMIEDFTPKGNRDFPMYKSASIFFTIACSEDGLARIARSPMMARVKCLNEANIQFLPIEAHAFSLGYDPSLFRRMFGPAADTSDLSDIADSLVTVCSVLEDYPLVRYADSTVSKKLAAELSRKLATHYDRNPEPGSSKGVLFIVDRAYDLLTPVMLDYYFQAMTYDFLDIQTNGPKAAFYSYSFGSGPDAKTKEAFLDEFDTYWSGLRHLDFGGMGVRARHKVELNHLLETNKNAAELHASGGKGKKDEVDPGSENAAVAVDKMAKGIREYLSYQDKMDKLNLNLDILGSVNKRLTENENWMKKAISWAQSIATTDPKKDSKAVKALKRDLEGLLEKAKNSDDKLRLYLILRASQSSDESILSACSLTAAQSDCVRNFESLDVDSHKLKREPREWSNDQVCKHREYESREEAQSHTCTYDECDSFIPRMHSYQVANLTKEEGLLKFECGVSQWGRGIIEGTLSEAEFPYVTKGSVDFSAAGKRTAARTTRVKSEIAGPDKDGFKPHLIIFVVGGMCHQEMRAAYELTKRYGKDVYIGSTHVFTPKAFIEDITNLRKPAAAADSS